MNNGSGTVRSNETLREARRDLFESFPHRATPAFVLRYQEVLAAEILLSESEKRLHTTMTSADETALEIARGIGGAPGRDS